MKKILLALTSITIGISAATAVSACGFIEPVNVILELSNSIAKPGSPILKAYRDIVDNYNNARSNNSIKVEVRETPANNIDNEIATGQPLPNLYVSYGDAATKYETSLDQIDEGDQVVDMAQAINWNSEYVNSIDENLEPQIGFIKKFANNATLGNDLTQNKPLDEITLKDDNIDDSTDNFHFKPLKDSFVREGSNNDKMYVVPTAKSGMNGVMNTRLLNELVKIVSNKEIDLATQIPGEIRDDGHFFADGGATSWIGQQDVAMQDLKNEWHLPASNVFKDSTDNIATLFNQWFGQVTSIKEIQNIMQDLSKLEVILLAYLRLVDSSTNRSYFLKHFSLASDDIPGLIYTMQSNLGYSNEQVYSWSNGDPYKLTLYKDGNNSQALADLIELFAWADNLRPLDNDAGNTPDHGYGGITAKLNTGMYYSDSWQQQGMLAYFGSTAGAAYWINPQDEDKYVQVEDIQLMSAPTYHHVENESFVVQQGPGMGMFKSKNQTKNEIAIDFLNYFIQPENNMNFAFAAGYIPSNYYDYYNENDLSGIPNQDQMGPYYQILNEEANNVVEKPNIKAAKIVKKYVDSILDNDIQLWTQIPSPFGDAMRYQILIPWFEANFKTIQEHNLSFSQFWSDLKDKSSIASAWRIVHGLFPVEGTYEIK